MPHAFDTGATVAQRTRIRNAIVALLAPLRKPAGYIPVAGIKPLAAVFRGSSDEGDLKLLEDALNGATPAIGVALGELPLDQAGMEETSLEGDLPVSVYVSSRQGRNQVDGRLAADVIASSDVTADPGVETMLEHALQLLAGQRLGLSDVGPLRAVSEDPAFAVFPEMTIGELRFVVHVEREIKPWRGVTQLVTEIENVADDIPTDNDGDNTTVAELAP